VNDVHYFKEPFFENYSAILSRTPCTNYDRSSINPSCAIIPLGRLAAANNLLLVAPYPQPLKGIIAQLGL
jgi:hypothetical protein